MDRLTQLRVVRFFIRKMSPFSECEDGRYREQDVTDWVACYRDTMRGTIGEFFQVVTEEVKLDLRPVLKWEQGVCVLVVLRKRKIEKFKSLYTPQHVCTTL